MISVKFNDKNFVRDMNNLVNYSVGFLEGVDSNKFRLTKKIGADVVERLKQFIDSNARLSPQTLHHVYEWHKAGSPDARLYDIKYRASSSGLSFSYTFRQSTSIRKGSNVPFYNKAKIMEEGSPVTIVPIARQALKFEVGGEEVFSRAPVTIPAPGGAETSGSFENIISSFFNNFFTQSFLRTSGMLAHLESLKAFRDELKQGAGKEAGFNAGARWVVGKEQFINVQE